MDDAATRYLGLLKRCLTRDLFIDEEVVDVMGWPPGGVLGDPAEVWPALERAGLRIVRSFDDHARREAGEAWPANADTMVGRARLDNVEELAVRALRDDVPGDLVETGVWRGGVVALMRAVLAAYGDPSRRVWACDSFAGLPEPDTENYPADAGHVLDELLATAVSVPVERVRANLARYDLLDDRVEFVEGWFRDTLHSAPIERIALLRLDGDLYESTMDALVALEPRVSPGGFVIVDDYSSWEPCRLAVTDYRERHGIDDPIQHIDWTGVWWQKSGPGERT